MEVISSLTNGEQDLIEMSSKKKETQATTTNRRGKRNVNCINAPLQSLTGTDEDREKKTLPNTNDTIRIQRTAGSHNAKQLPAEHHQERTDREIGIGLQQTAAIRQTLTRNIGIQQTSMVASMDDHQTKQSEIMQPMKWHKQKTLPTMQTLVLLQILFQCVTEL